MSLAADRCSAHSLLNDEIGNACVFFLSDLGGYVTGAYLPVTGGRVTQAGV